MSTWLDDESGVIRHQMEMVRASLDHRATLLADSTQRMLDWRGYLRRYPGVTAAVAMSIGFWLSPSRRSRSDVPAVSKTSPSAGLAGYKRDPVENRSGHPGGTLLRFISPLVSQAVSSMVKENFSQILSSALAFTSAKHGNPTKSDSQ